MKFAVLLLTIFLSEIDCARGKGWSSGGYKNEYLCPVEWGDYLKRLSLVIFMLSGVALYYVPKFRIYFHKGCHGVVDFVADGLKSALNVSDTECTSDCGTSFLSDRGSRLRLLEKKKPLASRFFSKLDRSKNHGKLEKNRFYYSSRTKEEPETMKNPMKLPWETIQLYPKNSYGKLLDSRGRARAKDSDSSEGICLRSSGNNNRRGEISTRNHGVSAASFHESEPTNYPEDLSVNDRTESDESEQPRYDNLYDLKKREKLERRLFEFDQTLRNLRTLFLRKYSTRNGSRDDFPAYLIEGILESLKRNFSEIEEDSQRMVEKHYRRSRGIDKTSLTRSLKKIVPLNHNNHQLMTKYSKTDNHHRDFRSSSPKYRKLPSNYSKNLVQATLSRKGTTVFLWDLKKR